MDDFAARNDSDLGESKRANPRPGVSNGKGVRGWLLVLCLMLTVVGPLISAWLVANEYMTFAPYFVSSRGLQVAIFVSMAITACSVAFGIYAGLRLWSIRPGAVAIAKYALLCGLAADFVTTTMQIAFGPTLIADGQLLHEVTVHLIPSLIFFTLCLGYLNKSARVHATYEA